MIAYSAEPGAPTGAEHPEIPHPDQPEEPHPIEIPADMRAPAPAVPSTEPIPEVAPLLHLSLGSPYPFPSTEAYVTLCRH